MSQAATCIDLHGRTKEDAIYEVSRFLERIRMTVANIARGRSNKLYVTIITGSGSHSTAGPVLRSSIHSLLVKRGMNFKIERGNGAFKVDALSGRDLHDAPLPTSSKVVTVEQAEFHQMAAARRNNIGGSYATMAQSAPTLPPPGPPRVIGSGIRDDVSVLTMGEPSIRTSTISSMNQMIRSTNPLPRQIASDDAAIRTATKQSVTELQQHRIRKERMSKEYEREFQRAVSESKLPSMEKEEEEDYEAEQLRKAYELSLKEEEKSTETRECEEEQLKMAYEQSLKVEQKDYNAEDDEDYEAEQLRIAYELSLKENDDQGSSIDYQSMQQSGRHAGEDQMDEYLDEDEVHIAPKRIPEEATSRLKVDGAEVEEGYEEVQLRMAYEQSLQEEQKSSSREDEEEAQLKLAYEQSMQEEKKGKDYEDEQLRLAYELSLKEPPTPIDEEEQLRLAYEESQKQHYLNQEFTNKQFEDALLLAIEQSNEEAANQPTSDEDLIEQALAESKALEEAKKASEEDELTKALQQSTVLEENRKSHHEQNEMATSSGIDLLEVVKTLSLKQQEEEALAEEEAIRRATEMSMRWT